MDASKLSQGQLVAAAGGVGLIVSLFLSWTSGVFGGSLSAFDAFSGMDIILLLIGVVALVFAGASAADAAGSMPPNGAWIVSALGLVAFGWSFGWDIEDSSAGIGAWLALIASIAITYGGYMAAHEPVAPKPARRVPRTPPGGAVGGSAEPPASSGPPTR
jgi:hypothetical protein